MTDITPDPSQQFTLGRLPSVPDARNLTLSDLGFFDEDDNLLAPTVVEVALAAWRKSRSAKAHDALHAAEVAAILGVNPTPPPGPTPPPPPPPAGGVEFFDKATGKILNQGNWGHCVGAALTAFYEDPNVEDAIVESSNSDDMNNTLHVLYYRIKREIEGLDPSSPDWEGGSTVHNAFKLASKDGKIGLYAWATSTKQMVAWLLDPTKGPIDIGIDWYNDMFYPDANGVIHPTGGIAGGHSIVIVAATGADFLPAVDAASAVYFKIQNSWTTKYGKGGFVYIPIADFDGLLAAQGEALCAVELAIV